MNAVAMIKPDMDVQVEPLARLRDPFPDNQISKLPKPTKKQTDDVKADFKKGVRCQVCGSWHHPDVVHLDYVGHAALTDRLLDTDLHWTWEPMAVTPAGLPAFDSNNGLWIKLTICGVTRIGYGCADGKTGGDAIKEIIGDALRNGGMRFGAALDLWHKGDLHVDTGEADGGSPPSSAVDMAINLLRGSVDAAWFKEAWEKNYRGWKDVLSEADYKRVQAVKTEMVEKFVKEAEATKAKEKPADEPAMDFPFDDEIPEFR